MNLSQKSQVFRLRFRGRDDVYAKKWYNNEGKGNYSFVCKKFFTEKCPIKLNTGTCATCKIKEHEPVTEASVIKHITGKEEHAMYVVRTDGMVYFGAFDFDCKPGGKADSTYYWEDVKKTCDVLDQLGIKYGIARSTTDGFHVYMFFAEPYSAHKFSQIVTKLIFKMTGFEAERANGIRKFPEFFPKQAHVGTEGYGNSIKPPMIEDRWNIQRNCFVNGNNEMINIDQQWNHLRDIPNNTPEHFDSLIKEHGISISEDKLNIVGDRKVPIRRPDHETLLKTRALLAIEDLPNVFDRCPAFGKINVKIGTGEVLSHDEGFALFHLVMSFKGGLEWFVDHVPGWGKSQADLNQLNHSIVKNYFPWSCDTLQKKCVCDFSNPNACMATKQSGKFINYPNPIRLV